MSHHEHLSKKEQKKALLKKNRFHQEMFGLVRMRRDEEKRVRELEEAQKPKRSEEKQKDEVWSAKVATIRNRLNDQRRDSKERWNRFAGTEGGGGRGL